MLFNIICVECWTCKERIYVNEEKTHPFIQDCFNCKNSLILSIEMWAADKYKNAEFIDINEIYIRLL